MWQKAFYYAGRTAVAAYMKLCLQNDVQWHTPLPSGAKIIAANHPTTNDPFYITTLIREPMHILVTEGAFDLPFLGAYLRRAGHIPAVRGEGERVLSDAAAYLQQGHTVTIFPEGALSPVAGGFGRPMTGAVRLALMTGAPIVPVGIHLATEMKKVVPARLMGQDTVGIFYPRGPYALTVGRAMRFTGDIHDWEWVRAQTERLMQQIAQLSEESAARIWVPQPAVIQTGLA